MICPSLEAVMVGSGIASARAMPARSGVIGSELEPVVVEVVVVAAAALLDEPSIGGGGGAVGTVPPLVLVDELELELELELVLVELVVTAAFGDELMQ
jgi:hypothetical protein